MEEVAASTSSIHALIYGKFGFLSTSCSLKTSHQPQHGKTSWLMWGLLVMMTSSVFIVGLLMLYSQHKNILDHVDEEEMCPIPSMM